MLNDQKEHPWYFNVFSPFVALFFAFFCSGMIILFTGGNPFEALSALIEGSLGSSSSLLLSLQKSIPLIFTGLSVGIGFRAGLFNIGAEGQLYIGAITAAWIAPMLPGVHGILLIPFILTVSCLAGSFWGIVPGYLKAKRGVHEVITTIMMNYIAIHFTLFLIKGPLRGDDHIIKTKSIPSGSELPVIWSSGALTLSVGLLIAILTALTLYFILEKTTLGYKIRITGLNKDAAEAAGFNVKKITVISMAIAGMLAGLGGAVEITGLHHTFYGQFSPGYGFDGIAVALIAVNHPIGIIFAALLFGALRAAERTLQLSAGVPHNIILIVQGLVILFVGIKYYIFKKAGALKKLDKISEKN